MPTIALSTLRSKVYARLDDNTGLYGTTEVDWVINEAIRTAALFTGFYLTTEQLPLYSVANRLVYATPSGILAPIAIYFEGRLLQKLSLRKLARHRRDWATDTTARRGQVEFWAPIGNTWFVISPKDSQGGRDMTIVGIGEPPALVNATDVMALENEYVELVVEYCAHRLPLKEGGKVFADGSLALNSFYDKLNERKRYETIKTQKYRLLTAKAEASA